MGVKECVSVYLDSAYLPSFGLSPQDKTLCVFQVLIGLQLTPVGRLSSSLGSSEIMRDSAPLFPFSWSTSACCIPC